MALELTKQSNFGIDAAYWHVAYFQRFSFKDKECDVFLHGFATKQHREGMFEVKEDGAVRTFKNSPVAIAQFMFSGDEFDFSYEDNITQKVYEKIKQRKDWQGAVDV